MEKLLKHHGQIYTNQVLAMTAEDLHAELAHRNIIIARLRQQLSSNIYEIKNVNMVNVEETLQLILEASQDALDECLL